MFERIKLFLCNMSWLLICVATSFFLLSGNIDFRTAEGSTRYTWVDTVLKFWMKHEVQNAAKIYVWQSWGNRLLFLRPPESEGSKAGFREISVTLGKPP